MGGAFRKLVSLFDSMGADKNRRILILGLDAAGKTCLLYKLKIGEVVTSIPTIGFNMETIKYKSLTFQVWDIGGQDRIRALWRHYYANTDAIVWVLDSNDSERFGESKNEISKLMMEDTLRGVPLLVYANKQDLPRAKSLPYIADALGLTSISNREWHIQASSATTGDGLFEGMEWLSQILNK